MTNDDVDITLPEFGLVNFDTGNLYFKLLGSTIILIFVVIQGSVFLNSQPPNTDIFPTLYVYVIFT